MGRRGFAVFLFLLFTSSILAAHADAPPGQAPLRIVDPGWSSQTNGAPVPAPDQAAAGLPPGISEEELQRLIKLHEASEQTYGQIEKIPILSTVVRKIRETLKSHVGGTPRELSLALAAVKVAEHPNRPYIVYGCLFSLLFVYLLKRWRLSLARSWYARLWIHVWALLLLIVADIILVPWMVFGGPYLTLTHEVIGAFTQ